MKTLRYALKNEWYNILILLLPFIALPFFWDQLPQQIATHWNFRGQVDGYSSRTTGALILPLINIALYLLLLYLPKIDPKKRITIGQKPMPILRTSLVCFLFAIHCWMMAFALGYAASSNWIFLAVGALFVVIGNYLRTIQPNYFIGIRVPWALEDPENWRRTHRLGSYLWVGGGLLLMLLYPFFGPETYSVIFGIVAAALALVPTVYSFYIYKTTSQP